MTKDKVKVLLATRNPGKITELKKQALLSGFLVVNDDYKELVDQDIQESGKTFQENAQIKLEAVLKKIDDPNIIVVADDSGLEIPALNNEPGVFTRRWAGFEMSDQQILVHCLKKMDGLKGDNRKAVFKTVLAVAKKNQPVRYFEGEMAGLILTEPVDSVVPVDGFPFRSVFYLPKEKKMIYELGVGDTLTHRQKAFELLINNIGGI